MAITDAIEPIRSPYMHHPCVFIPQGGILGPVIFIIQWCAGIIRLISAIINVIGASDRWLVRHCEWKMLPGDGYKSSPRPNQTGPKSGSFHGNWLGNSIPAHSKTDSRLHYMLIKYSSISAQGDMNQWTQKDTDTLRHGDFQNRPPHIWEEKHETEMNN